MCPATGSSACDATRRPGRQRPGPGAAADPALRHQRQPGAADHRPGLRPDLLPRRGRRPAHRPDPRRRIVLRPGQPLRRRLPQRRLDQLHHPTPDQRHRRRTLRLPVHHHHRRTGGHRPRRRLHPGQRPDHRRRDRLHPPGATRSRKAGPGFYVTGCTATTAAPTSAASPRSPPTTPGLFLTSDPDTSELRIGLQFTTTAQTSLTSLPLATSRRPTRTHRRRPAPSPSTTAKSTSTPPPASNPPTPSTPGSSPTAPKSPIRAVRVGGGN